MGGQRKPSTFSSLTPHSRRALSPSRSTVLCMRVEERATSDERASRLEDVRTAVNGVVASGFGAASPLACEVSPARELVLTLEAAAQHNMVPPLVSLRRPCLLYTTILQLQKRAPLVAERGLGGGDAALERQALFGAAEAVRLARTLCDKHISSSRRRTSAAVAEVYVARLWLCLALHRRSAHLWLPLLPVARGPRAGPARTRPPPSAQRPPLCAAGVPRGLRARCPPLQARGGRAARRAAAAAPARSFLAARLGSSRERRGAGDGAAAAASRRRLAGRRGGPAGASATRLQGRAARRQAGGRQAGGRQAGGRQAGGRLCSQAGAGGGRRPDRLAARIHRARALPARRQRRGGGGERASGGGGRARCRRREGARLAAAAKLGSRRAPSTGLLLGACRRRRASSRTARCTCPSTRAASSGAQAPPRATRPRARLASRRPRRWRTRRPRRRRGSSRRRPRSSGSSRSLSLRRHRPCRPFCRRRRRRRASSRS